MNSSFRWGGKLNVIFGLALSYSKFMDSIKAMAMALVRDNWLG